MMEGPLRGCLQLLGGCLYALSLQTKQDDVRPVSIPRGNGCGP
jgi:hypothetical protein